jgi:hypothetical protein
MQFIFITSYIFNDLFWLKYMRLMLVVHASFIPSMNQDIIRSVSLVSPNSLFPLLEITSIVSTLFESGFGCARNMEVSESMDTHVYRQ